jgi:hypothetical protein
MIVWFSSLCQKSLQRKASRSAHRKWQCCPNGSVRIQTGIIPLGRRLPLLSLSLSLSLFVSVFSRAHIVPFRMCFLRTCCWYSCYCLLLNFITVLFVHFLRSILSSRGERIESIEESINPFVGVNQLVSGSSLLLSFRVDPLRVSSQKWLATREGKTGALRTK